ncbi:hypothetical protein AVT44_gp05 [Acinetobacter phage Fri1]|uniref:Uncharacterized protein n=1 Tax=Acinetobacter phage Fri1 TaxID=1647373 RepID=A0A0H4TES9_9CAUD|nr:hypothetical protein AVT44_gp05 [Acinetobacter phage Fri1]AKQ06810.1 hypothetical protein Fri1_5 [Acinetobacter phage Fri1]
MQSKITLPKPLRAVGAIRQHKFTKDVAIFHPNGLGYTVLVNGGPRARFGQRGEVDLGPQIGFTQTYSEERAERVEDNWLPVPEGTVITIEV